MSATAQTYHINWDDKDSVSGANTQQFKRNGHIINDNSTPKNLLFRYDLSQVTAGHMPAMCFGDFCFFLFPGEDNPNDREAQYLPGGGQLKIYTLMNANGTDGISTFSITLFDKNVTSDSLRFTGTFFVGDVNSVPEFSTLGLTAGPLPATDVVTVGGEQIRTIVGANLYTADGTLVRTYGISAADQQTFTVDGLANGTYHLLLTTTSGSMVRTPVVIAR
jgi:hypothetical protein